MRRCFQNLVKYLEMKLFAKIVNNWKPLTIFAKSFILDVWLGSDTSLHCFLVVFWTGRFDFYSWCYQYLLSSLANTACFPRLKILYYERNCEKYNSKRSYWMKDRFFFARVSVQNLLMLWGRASKLRRLRYLLLGFPAK